jgi:hypothetical protein
MRDDERRRLEEIWTRYVGRESITLEERAALVSALERDEVLLRRLLHDLQIEGALRAAADVEHGQEEVVATVKALVTAAGRTEEVVAAVRKQLEAKAAGRAAAARLASTRVRGSRVLAAGVLLAGAAALAVLLPRLNRAPAPAPSVAQDPGAQQPARSWGQRAPGFTDPSAGGEVTAPRGRTTIARLESVDGAAYRHGADGIRRAAPALDVGAGDWVSTAGTLARARLFGPGGSRVELVGDTVAGVSADGAEPGRPTTAVRLFVAHGRATALVPEGTGRPALVMASPHAIVTGTGSVLLDVGTGLTRVRVKEGRARVSALGVQRGTDVVAGQLALVSAEDLQPPRAQTAVREALLLTGPDDTKEEPPPPGGIRGSEERLKARLERLGFTVVVVDAGALAIERVRAAALLVLSSSVSTRQLGPTFADLPVPMLVLESTGFERLGLSGARWRKDVGGTPPLAEIIISDPNHPLAAGLSGPVRVLTAPLNLRWAAPPPTASIIAGFAGGADQAALLFAYERGAQTAGVVAPARRVGMFLGNGKVIRALNDQGWRLFDAAVSWAAAE